MKVLSIVGARPQFIKAAIMSRQLRNHPDIQDVLVHTGQHYDMNMSGVFFDDLGLPLPAHNLHIGSGPHGQQTGRMLEALEQVMLEERPDWVLVYGDTNSTLAGALAAVKLQVPVAHVESGLRSFNRAMPEELNRVLTDHASTLLFAPTAAAVDNLRREGIKGPSVCLTGDVMYDAALHFGAQAPERPSCLDRLDLRERAFILCSVHRAETADDPQKLRAVFEGLAEVARTHELVLPLHPRTRAALERDGLLPYAEQHLQVIDPVGYLEMLQLVRRALLVATDSGGVQKEAFFFRVPCVTLRAETEWVELVDAGWNTLVAPTDGSQIARTIHDRIGTSGDDRPLYGGGQAAQTITTLLLRA